MNENFEWRIVTDSETVQYCSIQDRMHGGARMIDQAG